METITLAFLLTALAAYTVFGGADFGGGLLEAALHRHPRLRRKLQATLAPIWEANHVWLIAVVVILFVGFPKVYAALTTVFFFPVSLALLGIIFRGAFFTFRKYDPEPQARQTLYGLLFRAGSILTPAMFGFLAAALVAPLPVVGDDPSRGFYELFIQPWATVHGLLAAVFVNMLFAYLAAVLFHGELSRSEDRRLLGRRALLFFGATVASGAAVLAWGALSGRVALEEALNPLQVAAQVTALGCIPWVLGSLEREAVRSQRLAVGAQVLAILGGWFSTQYPAFLRFEDGTRLTVAESAAPEATLFWLNVGLAGVLTAVLPLLVYLFAVFRRGKAPVSGERGPGPKA